MLANPPGKKEVTPAGLVRRLAGGRGRIVNLSSIHEFAPRAGGADYDSAKGGLSQLTRTLALELEKRGYDWVKQEAAAA